MMKATVITYKDLRDYMSTNESVRGGTPYPHDKRKALAEEKISPAVIRQYYWEAVLAFQGDMDAMGRGIYLYWDATGTILDIATVPLDAHGDPRAGSAPSSHLLEEFAIPHQVAPYRYGATDWMDWLEAQEMMEAVPVKAMQWVKAMVSDG